MSEVFENGYQNVDEYRCELRSGEERAKKLLSQLANVRKEQEVAYNKLTDYQKNKAKNLARCQAKMAEYTEQIEKIKRCRHWYFYLLWWWIYMLCAWASTIVAGALVASIFDTNSFPFVVLSVFAFLCIYIPFRRWSFRIAEPEGNYENVDGVGPYLFMVCIPLLSLIPAYLFFLPIRGVKRGLYCKEQELLIEWEKYYNEVKDYKYQITEDKLEELSDEKWELYYRIQGELDELYCCENCKHATKGEFEKTYTCKYQSGLFIGCQACNVKK